MFSLNYSFSVRFPKNLIVKKLCVISFEAIYSISDRVPINLMDLSQGLKMGRVPLCSSDIDSLVPINLGYLVKRQTFLFLTLIGAEQ